MIKAIIIEDEVNAQDVLLKLIKDYLPQIQVVGTAKNTNSGKEIIESELPDLVFLDIELDDGTGFELLNSLNDIKFEVIFISGHTDQAIEAFKYKAIHFLGKPINAKELIEAVNRVGENKVIGRQNGADLKDLMNGLNFRKKIAVPIRDGVKYIPINEILYFKGEGSYSNIKLTSGKTLLVSKLIKDFESQLLENQFYRPSKSYLINLEQVAMFKRIDGGTIIMSDDTKIILSRKKKDDFLIQLANFI